MKPYDYTGFYQLDTFMIEVLPHQGGLAAVFPGTPPGFEVPMEPAGSAHTFTMPTGPAAGAPLLFQIDDDGQVTGLTVGGEIELVRLDGPPPPPAVPTGHGLPAPALRLDEEKEAAFAALVAQILERRDGAALDYNLPYPKYEFLMYAAMQDHFIFHGSGKEDIDEFITRRTSMELKDRSGRGNVQGVYGTHDGLWPLFFAVVDREKLTGSIRNGVNYFRNDAGEEIAIYNFSINQEHLAERPYRTGTLYLLPRDTFRRMPATMEGGLSNEWVSEVPVRPLTRLTIAPEEFPFLDQIGGHDDSELLKLEKLGKALIELVTAAERRPDGVSMRLNWQEESGKLLFEYVELVRQFIPTARLLLRFEPEDGTWLDFFGPPAVNQVMINRLEKAEITIG